MVGLLLAAGGSVLYVFTRPDDPVSRAVAACTGGAMQAVDFGLKAGVNQTGIVAGAGLTKQLLSSMKPLDSVEGTKQQFNYIACIDRRLAEANPTRPADTCANESDPCVDIVRVADFTASACPAPAGASGQAGASPRKDVADFHDTVLVSAPGVQRYQAVASPSGGAKLRVFRLDGANSVEVPAIEEPRCPTCPYPTKTFTLPVSGGKAEYRWNWVDGHDGDPADGLAFQSLYRIRSVHAHVKLPEGVAPVETKAIEPASVALKCVVGHNNIACKDLAATEMRQLIKWVWNWTLWSRCGGKQ